MNDKCCETCKNIHYKECPINDRDETWDYNKDFCSRYSPLPNKPGKIEPLKGLVNSLDLTPIIYKINELIAAHNGMDGK